MQNVESIIKTITHYSPHLLNETIEAAGVMVIFLLSEENNIEIVLTKRSLDLPTYAGDFSFPGGIRDKNDLDLYATAVRETQEELSIFPSTYQKIGELDDFKDRFGRVVRPFVVMMKKADFIKMKKVSEAEIIDIFLFPLTKLNQIQDNPDLHSITRRRPSYSFSEDHVFVWGLTAAILVHLRNVLCHTHINKLPRI